MRRTTVLDYTLQGSGYLFFDASLQSSQKNAPRFPTLISKLGKYQAKSSGPGLKKNATTTRSLTLKVSQDFPSHGPKNDVRVTAQAFYNHPRNPPNDLDQGT